jgi:hypothetical protein
MAYSDLNTIHTPATGTSPPATWGAANRNNDAWLAGDSASGNGKPMCRIYNSGNLSIATATNTSLTFDSERYDVGGCHSTSTNTSRLTVPTGGAGVYHIGGCAVFAATATGIRALWVLLNSSTRIVQKLDAATSGGDQAMAVSCDYKLAAGDYVELQVIQSSGGLLNINSSASYSPELWWHWVGLG